MKQLKKSIKITLIVLSLILTNIITGVLTQSHAEKEYKNLQSRIKATIDRNQAMEEELDAYYQACPDVQIDD